MGGAGGGEVTLGKEVCLVLPAPHSKDPSDLIRVGRVEEEGVPGALEAESGGLHVPSTVFWADTGSLPTQKPSASTSRMQLDSWSTWPQGLQGLPTPASGEGEWLVGAGGREVRMGVGGAVAMCSRAIPCLCPTAGG